MKLSSDSPMQKMIETLPQSGQLVWIGVRPERKAQLNSLKEVQAVTNAGLVGDHYLQKKGSKRQVTLVNQSHILAIGSIMKIKRVSPDLLRRNLVVEGINLLALKDKIFAVGEVILEYTGECHPCSRMEENLGPGGYNAVRGHGGITARILKGGTMRVNDFVKVVDTNQQSV